MAEPITMPYGLLTSVRPRNHVLDRGADHPRGRGNFVGKVVSGGPLSIIGTVYLELCKNSLTDRDAAWDEDSGGPKQP